MSAMLLLQLPLGFAVAVSDCMCLLFYCCCLLDIQKQRDERGRREGSPRGRRYDDDRRYSRMDSPYV